MAESLKDLLGFAQEIAWQAGKITLRHFQTGIIADRKADDSPVTLADRDTEAYLRAMIGKRYPQHAILGEEEGLSGSDDAEYRWVLDPIDGTKTFIRGVPFYGVLIGLLHNNEPVAGVINMPALNELVYAANGMGCYWNGRPCQVSAASRLEDALLVGTTAFGYEAHGKGAAFARLVGATGMMRTWADCYGYVLVATGRAEICVDPLMNIWDAAPMLPILREAGGSYTDWQGNPTIDGGEGVGTNGLLLDQVLGLIRG